MFSCHDISLQVIRNMPLSFKEASTLAGYLSINLVPSSSGSANAIASNVPLSKSRSQEGESIFVGVVLELEIDEGEGGEGAGWFMKSKGRNFMESRERWDAIERASWTEASLEKYRRLGMSKYIIERYTCIPVVDPD